MMQGRVPEEPVLSQTSLRMSHFEVQLPDVLRRWTEIWLCESLVTAKICPEASAVRCMWSSTFSMSGSPERWNMVSVELQVAGGSASLWYLNPNAWRT